MVILAFVGCSVMASIAGFYLAAEVQIGSPIIGNQALESIAAAVLGAEIAGVDLSRPLDDPTFAAVERAYDEYGVIFFRGQSITPARVEG